MNNKLILWPKVFEGETYLTKKYKTQRQDGKGYDGYGNGHRNVLTSPDGRGWGNRITFGLGRGTHGYTFN